MSRRPRTDLPETPLHPSLVRTPRVAGVERELMVPLAAVALLLFVGFGVDPLSWALGGTLVFGVLPLLRRLGRRDPDAFAVLRHHLAVAGFYPGIAGRAERRRDVGTL